jgi:catechol 2,3-dioxygenase-like lactoylglutathione lyase family enzyme
VDFQSCFSVFAGPEMVLFGVTIDAPDAPALARFYADLLDMEVTYQGDEGAMIAGGGKNLMFQQVSGYHPPQWPDPTRPQQAHLDIIVDDLDAARARALALGASRLKDGGEQFGVFADPAGHPFCLTL